MHAIEYSGETILLHPHFVDRFRQRIERGRSKKMKVLVWQVIAILDGCHLVSEQHLRDGTAYKFYHPQRQAIFVMLRQRDKWILKTCYLQNREKPCGKLLPEPVYRRDEGQRRNGKRREIPEYVERREERKWH